MSGVTVPSSERTADADVATIREVLLIEKGLAVTSSFHDPALAALDRLVARNQQLQEALAGLREAVVEARASLDTGPLREGYANSVLGNALDASAEVAPCPTYDGTGRKK